MALVPDYPAGIINVPKAHLTVVQLAPTEIYELDLGQFHVDMRELEESEQGRSWPRTHDYNAATVVSGVTIAPVINMTDYWTVTFEDGQYAVNLVGANSNVGDRINVNQVSVRTANSAGLASAKAIEFGEYGDAVTIKKGAGVTGSVYPIGTRRRPVNDFPNLNVIANFYGFVNVNIIGDTILDTGDIVDNLHLIGEGPTRTEITINTNSSTLNTIISDATVTGNLDGGTHLERCELHSLQYINGLIQDCTLRDSTFTLGGAASAIAKIIHCEAVEPNATKPIINGGGDGPRLYISNFSGDLRLENKSGSASWEIGFDHGHLEIDLVSVTAGHIIIDGKVYVTDQNGTELTTGTYGSLQITNRASGGAVTVDNNAIAAAVWSEDLSGYATPGTAGYQIDNLNVTVNEASIALAVEAQLANEFSNLPTAQEIVDQVWDEVLTSHVIPDSAADVLNSTYEVSVVLPNTADIADAVWNEPLSDHVAVGSAGRKLTDIIAGLDTTSIALAVEAQLADEFAGVSTPSTAAIAAAVETQLLDNFAAIPGAVDTQLADNFAAIAPPTALAIANQVSLTLAPNFDALPTAAEIAVVVDSQLADNFLAIETDIAAVPTVLEIRNDLDANSARLAAIIADTGTDIPALIAALNDFNPALDTVATVTSVTNQVTVDTAAIALAVETALTDEIAALNANIDANDVTALVTAVKLKTDQLVFTKAGEVDANQRSKNSATVYGDGTNANRWRGTP